jgi:2-polyprenyl-6-methoxyphenol hydroxylase-like FAD-dependent oxidoreductase
MTSRAAPDAIDVLVVGAGPTGLMLAAQLNRFGARFRIVDRAHDRAHESRALGVQARTLEILQQLGLGDSLVALGNKSAQVMIHIDGRPVASASLTDFAADDTRYPYILFVSQAETERLLLEHLMARGVRVERGVEFVDYQDDALGVSCQMRHDDGHEERLTVQYVAGCDGAHSTVRKRATIPFQGDAYLQDFMLGDVECDDSPNVPLANGFIHPCVGRSGIAIFFPLGHPATWRVIAMSARSAEASGRLRGEPDEPPTDELSLAELQAAIDGATGGGLRVHTPAWMTHFRLHHRQAADYRRGRVFVVGDAAHIHSPVGAQGMNTGIQDAWNLGWKLALVARGESMERLLDTYQEERWPVGRALLLFTDRAFSLIVRSLSPGKLTAWLRRTVPALILPFVLRSKQLRTLAFRFVSELDIAYRGSSAVREGTPPLRRGPKAGDRLPEAALVTHGREAFLHEQIAAPSFHLLLCGPVEAWNVRAVHELLKSHDRLAAHYLTTRGNSDHLVDATGGALGLLGVSDAAQYLVRPDGHIGYRCAGHDLSGVDGYLREWLPGPRPMF